MVKNLLEILTKGKSQTFGKPTDIYSVANVVGQSIF